MDLHLLQIDELCLFKKIDFTSQLFVCILFIFLIEIISFFKVDKYSVDGEIFVGSQNPEAGPGDAVSQLSLP